MLNDATMKTIAKVSTKEDFDILLNRFKTSEAPLDVRQEAMRELKAQHPKFDAIDKLPSKELSTEMKDGEADISDMGGFGN
jgi:hypothetical protein